jgi:phospholipid/cholesterol/gamma-HCH transport system substrate-binding protein
MLTREQRIGLFVLGALVLLVVAVELTMGVGLFQRRTTVYATFADVQGLDRGADVRLAGIRAGRVTDFRLDGDHVRVTMALDTSLLPRRDSRARLDFRALSGERFVALSAGTGGAPVVADGDTIEGETPAGIAEAVDRLAAVAASVNDLTQHLGDDAGRLLGTLADVVQENREELTALTQNLASITGKLDAGTGTLGRLVNDPALYDRVTAAVGDIHTSVADLGTVTRRLADGEGTLGKLVSRDDGLYSELRDTVGDLSATARNAAEITTALRSGQGTLGRALTDDSLYTDAQDAARTAGRAAQSVEDLAPMSLLGTIVTSLF